MNDETKREIAERLHSMDEQLQMMRGLIGDAIGQCNPITQYEENWIAGYLEKFGDACKNLGRQAEHLISIVQVNSV